MCYRKIIILLTFVTLTGCGSDHHSIEEIDSPDQLTTDILSSTEIKIAWNDNSDNEGGFIIQRSSDGISFEEVARVDSDVTTASDLAPLHNQIHIYRVLAYNYETKSEISETTEIFHHVFDACTMPEADIGEEGGSIFPLTVSGLTYTTDDLRSVTSETSRFNSGLNATVTFSIGFIPVSEVEYNNNNNNNITIADIARSIQPDITDRENITLNLTRLLLSLDEDGSSSNGIQLPCSSSMASGQIDFSLEEQAFNAQPDLLLLLGGTPLVTQEEASTILNNTFNNYYAGDYYLIASNLVDDFVPVISYISFTLNTDGSISNVHVEGLSEHYLNTAVFDINRENNLYFRIDTITPIFLLTVTKLRVYANIDVDHDIDGHSIIDGIFSHLDENGSVNGGPSIL